MTPERIPSTLGVTVARMRAAKGWTLDQLSESADVPRSTIHYLEAGKQHSTRHEYIASLATAFGVSIDALLSHPPSHEDAQRLPSPSRKLQKLTTP